MAWTAPRTFTTGELVTASMLNTHIRDNFLETSVAKVTTIGDITYATAANELGRLPAGTSSQLLLGGTTPSWRKIALICRVYQLSAGTSMSDSTNTVMLFDGEDTDPDGMHSTSSNTGRITVPRDGIAIVNGGIRFASNATGVRRVSIRRNGSTVQNEHQRTAGSTGDQSLETTLVWSVSANDYFELLGWQSSGGSLSSINGAAPAYTFFELILL